MFDRILDTPLAMSILICLQLLEKKTIKKFLEMLTKAFITNSDKSHVLGLQGFTKK